MRRGHHPVFGSMTLTSGKTNNNSKGSGGCYTKTTLSKVTFVTICLWTILQSVVFLQWQPPALPPPRRMEEEDGNQPLPPQGVVVGHVDDSSSRHNHKNEAKIGRNSTDTTTASIMHNGSHHHHPTTTTTTSSTCQFRNNQTLDVAWGVPTFIIGGAQKTGTTSLMYYLSQHSKIVPSIQEEAHFFDWDMVMPWWWTMNTQNNDNKIQNDNNRINKNENDDNYLKRLYVDPHTTDEERWCYLRHLYFKEWNASVIFPPVSSSSSIMGDGNNSSGSPLPLYSFEKTPAYIHVNDFIKYAKNDDISSSSQQQLFSYPNTPQHLLRLCPWVPKIIFILRNPVERAYSNYKMFKTQGHSSLSTTKESNNNAIQSFEDVIRAEIKELRYYNMTTMPVLLTPRERQRQRKAAVKNAATIDDNETTTSSTPTYYLPRHNNHIVDERYWLPSRDRPKFTLGILQKGMYALQLKYWFRDYPKAAIRVYQYEDLERNSRKVYLDLLQFCGIPPDNDKQDGTSVFRKRFRYQRGNETTAAVPMKNSTRRYLEEFYAPYNAQLEEVLGPTWKNVWR